MARRSKTQTRDSTGKATKSTSRKNAGASAAKTKTGAGARVRRSPEEARAVILAAARKVFAELGPDAAGLKQVAAEAGVSHGLITHYFGTFDGLVEATLAEHMHAVRQRLFDQISTADTLSAENLIAAFFEVIEDPLYGRLAAWAILSGRFQSRDFFPRKEQGPARIVDAVQRWFSAHGDEGIDRQDIELVFILVATAGIGYGMGKSLLWASLGHRDSKARDARFRALMVEIIEDRLRRAQS